MERPDPGEPSIASMDPLSKAGASLLRTADAALAWVDGRRWARWLTALPGWAWRMTPGGIGGFSELVAQPLFGLAFGRKRG